MLTQSCILLKPNQLCRSFALHTIFPPLDLKYQPQPSSHIAQRLPIPGRTLRRSHIRRSMETSHLNCKFPWLFQKKIITPWCNHSRRLRALPSPLIQLEVQTFLTRMVHWLHQRRQRGLSETILGLAEFGQLAGDLGSSFKWKIYLCWSESPFLFHKSSWSCTLAFGLSFSISRL
jgi:hypothetical protein